MRTSLQTLSRLRRHILPITLLTLTACNHPAALQPTNQPADPSPADVGSDANDPAGILKGAEITGVKQLATYLSRERGWLTPEVVDTLGTLSLRIDELFDSAPRLVAKNGVTYELKVDRVGDRWPGFDPSTDPFIVYFTQELYSELGDEQVLGYINGQEQVLTAEDLRRLPALGLAVSRVDVDEQRELLDAAQRVGTRAEIGTLTGRIQLGAPYLQLDRLQPAQASLGFGKQRTDRAASPSRASGSPSPEQRISSPSAAAVTACAHEAGVGSCNAQGGMVCSAGATPYFVLKNLLIRVDHEGFLKGNPEIELFPFNADGLASLPSQNPRSNILFHGQWTTDVAGRARYLPNVNDKYKWYSTDGVALFPFSMANVWIASLWENDNTRGVLDTTSSTSATVQFFNTPTNSFQKTFQLVHLGFLKSAALLVKNFLLGDGDDQFSPAIALTPQLACSSGLSRSAPRLLTLSTKEWDMQGYFACINPSCPAPAVAISGPDSFSGHANGTWTADVSTGIAPFTYTWTKGEVVIGSGPTVSTSSDSSFKLSVTITDAVGQTSTGSFLVRVSNRPSGGGGKH